jgi:hypothetical protein
MITYETGDCIAIAVDKAKDHRVIIPHVVNNRGAWGSGFVMALSERWPAQGGSIECPERVYYMNSNAHKHLGSYSLAYPEHNVIVANMTAQTLGGEKPLRYGHLARIMIGLRDLLIEKNDEIVAPMFGAARAGGDWKVIEELVEDIWCPKCSVTIVKYAGGAHG